MSEIVLVTRMDETINRQIILRNIYKIKQLKNVVLKYLGSSIEMIGLNYEDSYFELTIYVM